MRWFGWLLLIAYLAVSFGVHHLFPFYVFDMYMRAPPPSTSRVVARDARGHVREVRRYQAWDCGGAVELDDNEALSRCGAPWTVTARDDDTERWLVAHARPVPAGEHVDLVRRVWWFEADGTRVVDCPIRTCKAAP